MMPNGEQGKRRRDATDGPRPRRRRDDAGATLLLALLFLGAIGTIVGAIASWTSNDLSNTLVFQQQANVQSALSMATNVAIQSIRYTPLIGAGQTLNASPPSACFGTQSTSEVAWTNPRNGDVTWVDVWCSTLWDPTSAQTRTVTVSACLNDNGADTAVNCGKAPGLQTQVVFDDYSAANPTQSLAPCKPPPTGTCGSGMTINSSLRGLPAPDVTGLSSTAGPVTGGGTLTVSGDNFALTGTKVYFLLKPSSSSSSQNLVLQGTSVDVTSAQALQVKIPAATTTGTYNVVVSSSSGTSPTGPQTQYVYNPVVPVVSSATTTVTTATGGPTGSAAGGTTVTITGSGFLDSTFGDLTTVEFVDTATDTVYTAPTNTVSLVTGSGIAPGTELTVATPAVSTTDTTFWVVVVTAPGGSSGTANAPVFTYQPLLPLVASAVTTSGGATQGGSGTQVTLTGVGFISGNTTVQLVPTSGGFRNQTLTLTSVSVSGSTSLTATLPSGGRANSTYYVVATTPSGTSGTNSAPVFTYT